MPQSLLWLPSLGMLSFGFMLHRTTKTLYISFSMLTIELYINSSMMLTNSVELLRPVLLKYSLQGPPYGKREYFVPPQSLQISPLSIEIVYVDLFHRVIHAP